MQDNNQYSIITNRRADTNYTNRDLNKLEFISIQINIKILIRHWEQESSETLKVSSLCHI